MAAWKAGPSGAKALEKEKALIAALKRCATQKQGLQQTMNPQFFEALNGNR